MTGCKPNFESGGALADGGEAKLNSFIWVVWDESCGEIGVGRRGARRKFAGAVREQEARGLARGGLPLFLGFSSERRFHGSRGGGKAWRCRNHVGDGRLGFRDQGGGRVNQTAGDFRGTHGRRLQGLMVIEHPAGEHGFGGLLDPLIDQNGNFLPQVRSMVEAREFKALQRGARSRLQIVEGRGESSYGHGQSSNLKGWAERAGH
jgi:hypothetical protein